MSTVDQLRHDLVAELFRIEDLSVLESLQNVVSRFRSEKVVQAEPTNNPGTITMPSPPNPFDPQFAVQELTPEQILARPVERRTPEQWAKYADVYSHLTDEEVRDLLDND